MSGYCSNSRDALFCIMDSLNICHKFLTINFIAEYAVITPTYRPASQKEEHVVN